MENKMKSEEIKFLYLANTPLVIDKKRGLTVAAGGIINPLLFNLRTLINLEFSGHARKVAVLSDKEKNELMKKFEAEYELCQLPITKLPEQQIEELKTKKAADISNATASASEATTDPENNENSLGTITEEIKEEIAKIFKAKTAGVKKIAAQFSLDKDKVKEILIEKGLM